MTTNTTTTVAAVATITTKAGILKKNGKKICKNIKEKKRKIPIFDHLVLLLTQHSKRLAILLF